MCRVFCLRFSSGHLGVDRDERHSVVVLYKKRRKFRDSPWSRVDPVGANGAALAAARHWLRVELHASDRAGRIAHHQFNASFIGEPDGRRTSRVEELRKMLTAEGFDAPVRTIIRWNSWCEAVGAMFASIAQRAYG